MPLSETAMWSIIADHPLKAGAGALSTRLSKAHKIKSGTAQAAIREYRRYLYLTALDQGRTVPSRPVDAVWHMHLEEGADDYAALCRKIGHTITHTPGTPTGHTDDYEMTLDRYREEFDEAPPQAYWGPAKSSQMDIVGLIAIAMLMLFLFAAGMDIELILFLGLIGAGLLWRVLKAAKVRAGPPRLRDPVHKSNGDGGIWIGADCGGASDCGGGGCGGD